MTGKSRERESNASLKPILKWVGGKRQLLPRLLPLAPESCTLYCEPFLGGGAMLLALRPEKAIVGDLNDELMNVYRCVRDRCDEVIAILSSHENTREHFYEVRSMDRDAGRFEQLSDAERAARILYLNKTCYNGLYRVNAAGQFNSTFGRYKNPNIVNADGLRAVSAYLNECDVQLQCGGYEQMLRKLPEGSFVYLDPPYDPVSDTSSFTGYTRSGFTRADQVRLRECCDELDSRGVSFMLSNAATDFIRKQYAGYRIEVVKAKRSVNSKADRRAAVDEVVVMNYGV